MTLEKAILVFLKKYDYAVTQEWIINKVAWALYQTWKEVDEKEEKQNESSICNRYSK